MSRANRPARVNFGRVLQTQSRVLSALIVREALARYGHGNLGFFWVLAEPLLFSAAVMGLWALTKHAHMEGVGLVLFVLSGYCCLTLWRHMVGRAARGISQRSALLYHANIKPLDLLLATSILEVLGVFAAFVVAYAPLYMFDVVHPVRDPLLAIGGFLMLGWFAFGLAMVLAGLSERFDLLEKFITPAMYVTIPLTGVFMMVDWLPQKAQHVLLYSPMVHAVEMFRAGLMPEDIITHYSVSYLVLCCGFVTAIGILLMQNVQKHLGS